jgi:hypothetical protein
MNNKPAQVRIVYRVAKERDAWVSSVAKQFMVVRHVHPKNDLPGVRFSKVG